MVNRLLGVSVLMGALLASASTATAAIITLDAIDSGWYDETGSHNPLNRNYIVGQNRICPGPDCLTFRNWFAFDLAGVGNVTGATLRLYTSNYSSPDATETYTLFDVGTPVATLRGGGAGLVGIFNDLGTGATYGSRNYSAADDGLVRDITLNAAAIAAINAALGGEFALAGALTSLSGLEQLEFVFGDSTGGVGELRQLILQVPEPLSIVLLALGFAAAAARRSRKA
jgi:hypothetical protein